LFVLGVGGVIVVKAMGTPAATKHDAGLIAEPPPAADAAIVLQLDAAIVVQTDAAIAQADAAIESADIAIPAGEYEIGEAKREHPDALAPVKVKINDIVIDRMEATEPDGMPRRKITWQAAADACAALGKRLPSEAEWEIAAKLAPIDPAKATLLHGTPKLVPSPRTECAPNAPCDMLGSVLEWTADDWPGKKGFKVVRGASFAVSPDAGWLATIHARTAVTAKTADAELGYRCVKGEPIAKPVPPKATPPKPCDGRELFEKARDANKAGDYATGLATAQKALACKNSGADPQVHAAIVVAACALGQSAVAKQHFRDAPERRTRQLVKMCSAKGIQLP
jgi:hypothetical protein